VELHVFAFFFLTASQGAFFFVLCLLWSLNMGLVPALSLIQCQAKEKHFHACIPASFRWPSWEFCFVQASRSTVGGRTAPRTQTLAGLDAAIWGLAQANSETSPQPPPALRLSLSVRITSSP
jgi:hypothetical protein